MRCAVLVVCSWLLLASSAYAGFDEGVAALKRADFATALAELRPAAEQGNALAQVYVGSLYENGRGTDKDLPQAMLLRGSGRPRNGAMRSPNTISACYIFAVMACRKAASKRTNGSISRRSECRATLARRR